MSEPSKIRLTAERIKQIAPPASGEKTVWDAEVLGLGVRCLSSGAKTFIVAYRAGYGRNGTPRRVTLGKVEGLRVEDARSAALDIRGKVLRGEDPALAKRAERRKKAQPPLGLKEALGRYDRDQERRGVAGRSSVHSSLARHLLGKVGDVPLGQLDRRAVVEAIEALETAGLPGAARSLQSHASTFLKWCADRGLMPSNPLHGYRASRATRAQRVAQTGRALEDVEIARIWHAAGAEGINAAFGQLIRFLVVTGQRRTETARLRWADLSADRTLWTIPAAETKNGIAHEVPLPPLARNIIDAAPDHEDCEFVFSTNGAVPISGWSKLEPRLRAQIVEDARKEADAACREFDEREIGPWTLHDLRRTYRSGLTRLGVDPDVAEIMLNHRPETLRAVYDRDPRLGERRDAAERWARHVAALIDPDGHRNVVELRGAE